jgi:O-antigen/teichoic acid export membrane protein
MQLGDLSRQRIRAAVSHKRYVLEVSMVAEMLGSLLRSIVLARLLAPAEFGIAVALLLVVTLAEMVSDIGLERSILRMSPHVDVDRQRATLHSLAVTRGIILAVILFMAAPTIAWLFKVPDAAPAFAMLSMAVLLRGFTHLGIREMQRDYNFSPAGFISITVHVVSALVTIVAALILRSHVAMLFGILASQIVSIGLNHYIAPQRWRLGWHGGAAREAWAYGAPLIPSGLANAFKSVGDRFIVGVLQGSAPLAIYNVTMMVGLLPRVVIMRYMTGVFLPRFVNSGDGPQSEGIVSAFAVLLGAIGLVMGVGLWALGQPVITLVFGAPYTPEQALVGTVGVLLAGRFLLAVVTAPALAFGATRLLMFSSIGSLAGLGLAALTLLAFGNLTVFVSIMALADIGVLVAVLHQGRGQLAIRNDIVLPTVFGSLGVLVLLAVLAPLLGWSDWVTRVEIGAVTCVAATIAATLLLRRAGISLRELKRLLLEKPPRAAVPATDGDGAV